jgi:hypothetical protein
MLCKTTNVISSGSEKSTDLFTISMPIPIIIGIGEAIPLYWGSLRDTRDNGGLLVLRKACK